ncbi:MAG: hypothetical protein WCD70_11830 [Alphaproteobacteria bacterium]
MNINAGFQGLKDFLTGIEKKIDRSKGGLDESIRRAEDLVSRLKNIQKKAQAPENR